VHMVSRYHNGLSSLLGLQGTLHGWACAYTSLRVVTVQPPALSCIIESWLPMMTA